MSKARPVPSTPPKTMANLRTTLLLSALGMLGAASAAHAGAPRKSNSLTMLPRNLHVGDVDGDGLQDFVQYGHNKIFAYRANYERDGILHAYLPSPVERLILGDFTTSGREKGRDQVCAVLHNKTLRCYSSSDDNRTLWWWFVQSNFIGKSEQIIVGDYDGNGADDLLLYNSKTGGMRFWTMRPGKVKFQPMTNVSLGELAQFDRRDKILLTGDFGQGTARDDLLLWDRAKGQLSRYDSIPKSGQTTFRLAFHTAPGFLQGRDLVRVANLEGGPRDGVAVFDPAAGTSRFYRAREAPGGLQPAPVTPGNLAGKEGFLPVFGHFATQKGERGDERDDLALYKHATGELLRLDARWDPKRKEHTFWSAFRAPAPANHAGWPATRKDRLIAGKCKFADISAEPGSDQEYRDRLSKTGAGKHGLWDFMWDISYGTVDIDATVTSGWRTMDLTLAQWMALDARHLRARKCLDTWGVDYSKFPIRLAFVNSASDVGQNNEWAVFFPGADHANMLGHEILHTNWYDLPHSMDDKGDAYGDGYDIMGGVPNLSFSSTFGRTGVGLHSYNLERLGFLPDHRTRTLTRGSKPRTDRLRLAAVNRPESNGYLLVKIPKSELFAELAIEFRDSTAWDRGFPEAGVMVRRVGKHPDPKNPRKTTYLQTTGAGPMFTKGEVYKGHGVTITVKQIRKSAGTAEIEIVY